MSHEFSNTSSQKIRQLSRMISFWMEFSRMTSSEFFCRMTFTEAACMSHRTDYVYNSYVQPLCRSV